MQIHQNLPTIPVASDTLPEKPSQDMAHLPGPKGHWLTGNLRELLPNPRPLLLDSHQQHGNCFTVGFFRNTRMLVLAGREANEAVLLDRDNNFSSRWGWAIVHLYFGRNVLVRDFEDHRQHRQIMTSLFKPPALRSYLEAMNPIIESSTANYNKKVDVYRQTKQLALDIAVQVFAGFEPGPESVALNQDLTLVLDGVMAHRLPVPGTRHWRGVKARDRLRALLSAEVPRRRQTDRRDMLSQLSAYVSPAANDGINKPRQQLSTSDVVDHMFGMLFAAHDTTASAMAMMLMLLAKHPDWQTALRDEVESVAKQTGAHHLPYEALDQMPLTEAVLKETLRLYAPIQFIPRRSIREFQFGPHRIPANTHLLLAPQAVHFDAAHYPDPLAFRPDRFTAGNQEPFTFIPFGKGSHMCLGMHFAEMEVKAVMYQLLQAKRVSCAADYEPDFAYLPMVRPTRNLVLDFQ